MFHWSVVLEKMGGFVTLVHTFMNTLKDSVLFNTNLCWMGCIL